MKKPKILYNPVNSFKGAPVFLHLSGKSLATWYDDPIELLSRRDVGRACLPAGRQENLKFARGRRLIVTSGVILLLGFIFLKFVTGTRAVSWWTGGGGSWQARKQLTITNNSSASLSANTTIAIIVDTKI